MRGRGALLVATHVVLADSGSGSPACGSEGLNGTAGRCGALASGVRAGCDAGRCCSASGWCGTSGSHCTVLQGADQEDASGCSVPSCWSEWGECYPYSPDGANADPNTIAMCVQRRNPLNTTACAARSTPQLRHCDENQTCAIPGLIAVYYPYNGTNLTELHGRLPFRNETSQCLSGEASNLLQHERLSVLPQLAIDRSFDHYAQAELNQSDWAVPSYAVVMQGYVAAAAAHSDFFRVTLLAGDASTLELHYIGANATDARSSASASDSDSTNITVLTADGGADPGGGGANASAWLRNGVYGLLLRRRHAATQRQRGK